MKHRATFITVVIACVMACAGSLFAQSVPYGAERAIVRHFTQTAVVHVWLLEDRVHAYFDLFDDRFFVSPAGWRAGDVRATSVLCDDGTDGTGEFTENAHFIIEFPPEADLAAICVNYDRVIEFHLTQLTEAELSAFSPETEQAVRAHRMKSCGPSRSTACICAGISTWKRSTSAACPCGSTRRRTWSHPSC